MFSILSTLLINRFVSRTLFTKDTHDQSIALGWVNYAMVNAICNSQQLIGVLNLPILHQADAELQRIENQFEITETGRFSNFKFSA